MIPDRIVIVDWSASAKPSPARPSADAIWIGDCARGGEPAISSYHRTRHDAERHLHARTAQALGAGERLLIGADFPFGYPAGFAAALTGCGGALALWDWLARHVTDGPDNANDRFALADAINARFPGLGPFWGRPRGQSLPNLPEGGRLRHGHGLTERRVVEHRTRSAQPCWKLFTTGSVGSQALLGIPAMARLRAAFPGKVAVWPLEPWGDAPVVLAEVYPSLLARDVAMILAKADAPPPIKDDVQVRLLATVLRDIALSGGIAPLFHPDAEAAVLAEEGWILGVGGEAALTTAARAIVARGLQPRRIR